MVEAEDGSIAEYRAAIIAQADAQGADGWMTFTVPVEVNPSCELRVPRAPFELWAVARSGGGHLAPPWNLVSPPGLKMMGDDRFHSDWMLGAGLALDAMRPYGDNPHWEALSDAAGDARYEIEKRLLHFRCSVLLPGPWTKGLIFVPNSKTDLPEMDDPDRPPVAVLPNAGPDYLDVALTALDFGGAVIVEKGGEMAHLITVLREHGKGPIVRVPDARKKYPPNALVYVSSGAGEVQLAEDAFPEFANEADPFRNGSRYQRVPDDDPLPSTSD